MQEMFLRIHALYRGREDGATGATNKQKEREDPAPVHPPKSLRRSSTDINPDCAMLSFRRAPPFKAPVDGLLSPGRSTPSPIGRVMATDWRLSAFSAADTEEDAGGFRRQKELLDDAVWACRTRALRRSDSDEVPLVEEAVLESEVEDMKERIDDILRFE